MPSITQSISCLLLSLSVASVACAKEEERNLCEEFGIQVFNKTGKVCTLESYQMAQGIFISIRPDNYYLPPNASQNFYTRQNWVDGPTLVATYSCEGEKIMLESHQNFCYAMSGNIRGAILSADRGVTAKYTTKSGSHFWNNPGNIYWTLS